MSGKPAAQRAVIAVGILGGLGLAAAAYLFVDPEPSAEIGPSDPPLIQPSSPGGSSLSPSASQSPSATPTVRPSAQGPAITPTVHVDARSRPDGSFDVTETVLFRTPQNWLLVAPPEPSAGGPALATVKPRAVDLRVTSQGRTLQTSTQEIAGRLDLTLGETVPQVELHYRLTGASVRSTPSTSRRALALLAPLSGASDETLRTTLTIRGAAVKNLYCPLLPEPRRLCAAAEGPQQGVISTIAAGQALVVVQLDLPATA